MAPKVVAILLARCKSERLPGKILLPLKGKTVLEHVIERIQKVQNIHSLVIATSDNTHDDPIALLTQKLGLKLFRGSEDDVLARFYEAAKKEDADVVIRVNCDSPLVDPEGVAQAIDTHIAENNDYTYNKLISGVQGGYPLGTGIEVISFSTLERVHQTATEDHHREHVTLFILQNKQDFTIGKVSAPSRVSQSDIRLVIDTPQDYELFNILFNTLYDDEKGIDLYDVIQFIYKNDLTKINEHVEEKGLKYLKK